MPTTAGKKNIAAFEEKFHNSSIENAWLCLLCHDQNTGIKLPQSVILDNTSVFQRHDMQHNSRYTQQVSRPTVSHFLYTDADLAHLQCLPPT